MEVDHLLDHLTEKFNRMLGALNQLEKERDELKLENAQLKANLITI